MYVPAGSLPDTGHLCHVHRLRKSGDGCQRNWVAAERRKYRPLLFVRNWNGTVVTEVAAQSW